MGPDQLYPPLDPHLGDKASFAFPVSIISQRERERDSERERERESEKERKRGLFALLLLYYMYCFNVFFSFNVAFVYCLFLIVPWDGL